MRDRGGISGGQIAIMVLGVIAWVGCLLVYLVWVR